jgi:16S rRNA (adenine1518-N6/adenine1519-N6)-dimethyltransferase
MVRLGQNFLADPNLLDAIARLSEVADEDVVLEVGGGEGVLTARLAPLAREVLVVEIDERLRPALEDVRAAHGNVRLVWGDAMRVELAELDPPPTAMVSNLPYSIATPILVRTVCGLEGVRSWTVMVQREIADRLRAGPGSRLYGAPSVVLQLACEVRLLRRVDRAVFTPRPRVDSAILRLERIAPPPSAAAVRVVRAAFAHRRKTLAGSLELAGVASREAAREALAACGLEADARAEALAPEDFTALVAHLPAGGA